MLFSNPTYLNALLSKLRILELFNRLWFYKKKAVRTINFQPRNFHTTPLFKQNSILKFQDKIYLESISFVSRSINKLTPLVFYTWFSFSLNQHIYETSSSRQDNLIKSSYRKIWYGKYSVIASAIDSWNKIKKKLKYTLLKDLSPNNCS